MIGIVLDVVTVVSSSVGIWATINTTYRCMSPASFDVDGATVTFSNMRLEAYMPGNDLSPTGNNCSCSCARAGGILSCLICQWNISISRYRECVYSRPGQHYEPNSNQHHSYNNHSSTTNPSKYTWTWQLHCKQQQWYCLSLGPDGTAAQCLLFF